jgi:hypothetical protein
MVLPSSQASQLPQDLCLIHKIYACPKCVGAGLPANSLTRSYAFACCFNHSRAVSSI